MQVIPVDLYESLEELDPKIKAVILKLIKYWGEIVKRDDFLELKKTVEKLADSVEKLAEVQKKTEYEVRALAEAQRKTEER
ncbi:MAG: chordopoxvirus fusion protein, partial [Thermodesulfobacterium geofontis]